MTTSNTPESVWSEFVLVLDAWRQRVEARFIESYRFAYDQLLRAGGDFDLDHPIRLASEKLTVDFEGPEFELRIGWLTPSLQEGGFLVLVLRKLCEFANHSSKRIKKSARFKDFWKQVKANIPKLPKADVRKMAKFADEAKQARSDPFGLWPLLDHGMTEGELMGETLQQVSKRSGISLESQMSSPHLKNDFPVLSMTDVVQCSAQVGQWTIERGAWARVIGWIRHLLPDVPIPS